MESARAISLTTLTTSFKTPVRSRSGLATSTILRRIFNSSWLLIFNFLFLDTIKFPFLFYRFNKTNTIGGISRRDVCRLDFIAYFPEIAAAAVIRNRIYEITLFFDFKIIQ